MQKLLRIGRNTPNLERAMAFYRDGLGFRVEVANAPAPAWTRLPDAGPPPARCMQLALGAQQLLLTEFPDATPYPDDIASNDVRFQHCAIVVPDVATAYARVMRYGAKPITQGGPQTLPPSAGHVACFKFRDPDGHPLELIQFPHGAGDRAWQSRAANETALGIDHSAISVTDVERSVRFYQLLGLHVAARSVNQGAEQQRLDGLAGVLVDVVAMQAVARTPHLELLGYRQPRGCTRPAPGTQAVAADRTVWQARGIDVLLDALDAGDFSATRVASGRIDNATIALLRDPDGHRLALVEPAD